MNRNEAIRTLIITAICDRDLGCDGCPQDKDGSCEGAVSDEMIKETVDIMRQEVI